MDNKITYVIVALVVSVAVLAAGLIYLQGEIHSLKTNQPTPTQAETTPNTSQPTSDSNLQYTYVVYEFSLKSDYINNQEWLSQKVSYNQSLSWKANYFTYLAKFTVYPTQMQDSTASMLFSTHEYVSAELDANTGTTKVTYNYVEYDGVAEYYSIEHYLPDIIADGTGWDKYYV